MNRRANISEFRRLDQTIERTEAEAEAARWRQAELAAEAIDGGMTRTTYAEAVGKSPGHISTLVKMAHGFEEPQNRPRFATAYETAHSGGGELVTQAEGRKRRAERQVPTRHQDRVEMAGTLLADPDVAQEAVATVLAAPSQSQRIVEQAVHRKGRERRQRAKGDRERDATAGAVPLPAYMAAMVERMTDWALGLDGLLDDLDQLPEGPGRDSVAAAAERLAMAAQAWVDRLAPHAFVVIEGQGRQVG